MILDWIAATKAFTLTVPRSEGVNVSQLVNDHGLDLSTTGSTKSAAMLFTREPYAAASFGHLATPAARQQLGSILDEIEASRANTTTSRIFGGVHGDKELWPFQVADLHYALRRKNTLVGDEPGLGKTPIAICFANEIVAKRILVICPASIRLQWQRRIYEWSKMREPVVDVVRASRRGVHPDADWTVVSYDLARTEGIGTALAKGTYDLLILDEAHYAKEVDSRRTRAIFGGGASHPFAPLATRAGAIMALTGTPLPNRPREAYVLARGMCWDSIDWMSEDSFRHRFNPSRRIERVGADGKFTVAIDERTGRHAELQNRLRANFMTRHLKREVLPQLHLPVYDLIQVDETSAVKQALQAESLLEIDPEFLEGADAETLGHIATVRKMMGIAMAPQVADYVSMLLDSGEDKLVLFAWHIEVLNILEERLARYGSVRIDGRTSTVGKEARVLQFRTDPSCRIAMGNILSMGTGTDGLQDVCCHGLIAEPDWVPGNNIQCFDRLDRFGQRETVQGDIFVAPNSFAEKVLASALRKLSTVHKTLDRRVA